MSGTEQPDKEGAPESPTTARPLEMDDDDVQEAGAISMEDNASAKPITTTATSATATTTPTASTEAPPAKPPRPQTEQQKNEAILKEAFPSIDINVIKAVLIASGNKVDPAFNALLQMTDPDAVQQEAHTEAVEQPPPQPPRPRDGPRTQLEADEAYARQLAQHYDNVGAYEARTSNPRSSSLRNPVAQGGSRGEYQQPPRGAGLKPNELYDDRDHSFFDDDLPVIRENLRKGFQDTQNKVTNWFNNFTKQFDDTGHEEGDGSQHSHQRPGLRDQGYGANRASTESGRRSRDYDRYDADPELLSDDFAGMRFHGDGSMVPTAPARSPQQPSSTNPNVFRPPPPTSSSPGPGGRKVAFKDGREEDPYSASSPAVPPKDGSGTATGGGGRASKWQPMSNADPTPIAENDPFSLGDSDDERDAVAATAPATSVPKDAGTKTASSRGDAAAGATTGGGGINMDDAEERLRKSTAEAMSESLVEEKGGK